MGVMRVLFYVAWISGYQDLLLDGRKREQSEVADMIPR